MLHNYNNRNRSSLIIYIRRRAYRLPFFLSTKPILRELEKREAGVYFAGKKNSVNDVEVQEKIQ